MSKLNKNNLIKPLEGYTAMSDDDVVSRGTAVVTGLTGNSHFLILPVDLATLKANVESFHAFIVEAQDGSRKVIAQRNKQREAVIKMLRLLARYVEVTSDGDMAVFTSSGFVPASTTKLPPSPLPLPVIRSVTHGVLSGELVVQVEAIRKAVNYEIRYGTVINGAAPSSWTSKVITKVRPPVGIEGLAPGTIYAIQVRALGPLGYTAWTDSTTCMCT
jgi:hypothetical protein